MIKVGGMNYKKKETDNHHQTSFLKSIQDTKIDPFPTGLYVTTIQSMPITQFGRCSFIKIKFRKISDGEIESIQPKKIPSLFNYNNTKLRLILTKSFFVHRNFKKKKEIKKIL